MPLAEGMRVVDTMWLSQIFLAKIEGWFGAPAANLFAATVWLTYALLARAFYLTTRRLGPSMLGAVIVFAVGWSRVTTIRPEMFSLFASNPLAIGLAAGSRSGKSWPVSVVGSCGSLCRRCSWCGPICTARSCAACTCWAATRLERAIRGPLADARRSRSAGG